MFFPPGQVHMALVTIQQGLSRGLAGPLAGCGARKPGGFQGPPFSLTPPPEAAQEKGDLNSYWLYLIDGSILYMHRRCGKDSCNKSTVR